MGCPCANKRSKPDAPLAAPGPNMPLNLVDKNTTPPGGYQYYQVESRTRITAPTLEVLADLVRKHRQSNELPGKEKSHAEVMDECQEQMCATAPPGICRDPQGAVKMTGTSLNFQTITRGAETLWDFFFKHGRKIVDPALATERARICGNCFANRKPEGCTSCATNWLRELSEKFVGGAETPHDAVIHSCAFCGCQLRSLIWMPLAVVVDHTPIEELKALPSHCWKHREISGEQLLPPATPPTP
jgi:hypothetical protein